MSNESQGAEGRSAVPHELRDLYIRYTNGDVLMDSEVWTVTSAISRGDFDDLPEAAPAVESPTEPVLAGDLEQRSIEEIE